MKKLGILTKGIIKENPTLVLLLGTCPTLATTTSALNGLGMGVATLAVLVCSNILVSILRKVIPDKVRIPCYIVIIAGFTTLVQFVIQAFVPALYESLGIFIPLIVVNCILLGRAEMFASKNTVIDSALDGLGMGIGFSLALGSIGLLREILGAGTFFGFAIPWLSEHPIMVLGLAPGGFFFYGVMIAIINAATKGKAIKKKDFGCAGCSMKSICHQEKCKQELEGADA